MKNEKAPAKPKAGVVLAEGRVRVKALNQGRALYVRRAKKEKPMWLEQDPMDCRTHQAPRSMEFSRQEYWSALPCPPPGDLPDPGIACGSCIIGRFFTAEPQRKPMYET